MVFFYDGILHGNEKDLQLLSTAITTRSEGSWTRKTTCCVIPFVWSSKPGKANLRRERSAEPFSLKRTVNKILCVLTLMMVYWAVHLQFVCFPVHRKWFSVCSWLNTSWFREIPTGRLGRLRRYSQTQWRQRREILSAEESDRPPRASQRVVLIHRQRKPILCKSLRQPKNTRNID